MCLVNLRKLRLPTLVSASTATSCAQVSESCPSCARQGTQTINKHAAQSCLVSAAPNLGTSYKSAQLPQGSIINTTMVLQMWVPGLTLPAHPVLVHASAQRSAIQPDAALQRRLGSHAALAQAAQDQLALVPPAGAAKRKVGNHLQRNKCGACCWSVLACISRTKKWSCQVADLLLRGTSLQSSPPEMKDTLDALVAEHPTAAAGAATLSGRFEGTWEVPQRSVTCRLSGIPVLSR